MNDGLDQNLAGEWFCVLLYTLSLSIHVDWLAFANICQNVGIVKKLRSANNIKAI